VHFIRRSKRWQIPGSTRAKATHTHLCSSPITYTPRAHATRIYPTVPSFKQTRHTGHTAHTQGRSQHTTYTHKGQITHIYTHTAAHLHSHPVLVQRQYLAHSAGRASGQHDGNGGPVAGEGLVRDEVVRHVLRAQLLRGLAVCQSISLRMYL
jgi:hypothetical protein